MARSNPVSGSRSLGRKATLLVVGLALALPLTTASAKKKNKASKATASEARTVEDLQIVDCLLPGQVRQLGRRASFVTARRPIRTTVVDCEIRGGEYTSHDPSSYASALAAWLPAAEAGDAAAQTYVGEIFEKGLAGTSDYASAAAWYSKAAEKGFSRGQINLAHLYENGLGVSQDQEKALGLYRQAAGITDAMVLDQREEVAALQAELEKSAQEAAELQGLLEESEENLEAARSALDAARSEVEELRQRVEEAKTAQEEAEAARLASQLDARQAQMVARAKAVEELDAKLQRYRARIAKLNNESKDRRAATAGPSIEIVRPDVLTTRGPALVRVPTGQERMEIAGRVTAPAGLEGLTLDEGKLTTDASGFFLAEVPAGERREVVLEAKDRQGKSVQATLVLIPGSTVSERGSGRGSGRGGSRSATDPRPEDRVLRDRYSRVTRGKNHALVISVTEYEHMPKLATASFDGNEVRRLLQSKYGFQVRLLQNPTNVQVFLELDALRREVGPEANLLIYYAGHGKIGEGDKGYWIPVDGEAEDTRNWISNEAVSDMLDVIPAKHIMVVSDSCYSGTLTRSGVARLEATLEGDRRKKSFEAITGKRSRTVLTSGGLQPVLDEGGEGHSHFARAFLNVLERNEDVLLGVDLHREVSARVRFGARSLGVDQRPDYAPIRFAGHEAGDFALVPRGTAG